MKLGHRDLVDGNVIENSWADGQQGFCVLVNARTCSGGEACGIYNPSTGLPNNYIDNIRFSNNWVRNCPEPVQMSNRSGSIPNGGGVSLPVQDNDFFVNNLFTNISDYNQWGRPGTEWEWTSGQDQYRCTMTATGSIVTAGCLPCSPTLETLSTSGGSPVPWLRGRRALTTASAPHAAKSPLPALRRAGTLHSARTDRPATTRVFPQLASPTGKRCLSPIIPVGTASSL